MSVYAAILMVGAGSLLAAGEEGGLLVHAPAGSIRGVPAPDGDYVMFLGIPYARVNASNPFGAAIPHEKFDKTFEASTESAVCPQMKKIFTNRNSDRYDGTLDCLRLNVFVPKTETKHRGVYIFVFGGKFVEGDSKLSSYGPKYLVRHDIIVVTFNFRSGPYGFMCADIPEIPGNQAGRDQYAAIEWVRDNIRAFGGDPGRLTLGGHSSGAQLVDMHLLTERPRLFRRAILQSGTTLGPDFLGPSDPMALVDIAGTLGFETNDTSAALSFLAEASPEAVVEATVKYEWRPCVEKKFPGVVPFVAENPEFSEGRNVDGLDILGGFTDREYAFTWYFSDYRHLYREPDSFRYTLEQKFNLWDESDLVDIVRRFYVDDDGDRDIVKDDTVDLLSDFAYAYPMQRQLMKYAKHPNSSVYLYVFSYDGCRNRMKIIFNITDTGATHSDELGYMFTMDLIPEMDDSRDRRMIDRLTTLWANFVKYGEPTPARTALLPVVWPPLTADTVPALRLDADLTVISRPLRSRMAFWDLFYDAHLDKLRY
ncbi:juvenile hormone esterase-like [Aricia agestis]|uniref:juvenile hormone esterase-like n=1 Tax=Aricia agestis TaxID=91739 RepID=UPI001C20795B|nr:juvenile hormone esterase-like [Aricia agestis]